MGDQGFAHDIRAQALQALAPGVQRSEGAKQRQQDLLLATCGSPGVAHVLWHCHLTEQGGQCHQSHRVLAGHFRQRSNHCPAPVALLVVQQGPGQGFGGFRMLAQGRHQGRQLHIQGPGKVFAAQVGPGRWHRQPQLCREQLQGMLKRLIPI